MLFPLARWNSVGRLSPQTDLGQNSSSDQIEMNIKDGKRAGETVDKNESHLAAAKKADSLLSYLRGKVISNKLRRNVSQEDLQRELD